MFTAAVLYTGRVSLVQHATQTPLWMGTYNSSLVQRFERETYHTYSLSHSMPSVKKLPPGHQ